MNDVSPTTARTTVVNIISTSYSGSTWTNLLLGSHSQMFSAGEIDALIRSQSVLCSLHGPDCRVWSGFVPHPAEDLYPRIGSIASQRILVVNNARYTLKLQYHPSVARRFLFLVRDGRAVVHSDLSKHPGAGTWRSARSWARGVKKKWRTVRRFGREGARTLLVHYERLRDDTRAQLERICDWLGLAFEPAMLEYWKHPHHFIGGNVGPLTYVARGQGLTKVYSRTDTRGRLIATELDAPRLQYFGQEGENTWDLQRYQHQAPDRFRDERWKSELTDRQLRIFALAAGRTNRRFGYPPSLDRCAAPAD